MKNFERMEVCEDLLVLPGKLLRHRVSGEAFEIWDVLEKEGRVAIYARIATNPLSRSRILPCAQSPKAVRPPTGAEVLR